MMAGKRHIPLALSTPYTYFESIRPILRTASCSFQQTVWKSKVQKTDPHLERIPCQRYSRNKPMVHADLEALIRTDSSRLFHSRLSLGENVIAGADTTLSPLPLCFPPLPSVCLRQWHSNKSRALFPKHLGLGTSKDVRGSWGPTLIGPWTSAR